MSGSSSLRCALSEEILRHSPLLDVTPRNATLARLLCDLFRDSITEKVYDAELAGLQFSIDFGGDHITLGTVGYNDKLADLTESMLKLFMGFKIDLERFGLIKDQVSRCGKQVGGPELDRQPSRSNEAGSTFPWTSHTSFARTTLTTWKRKGCGPLRPSWWNLNVS